MSLLRLLNLQGVAGLVVALGLGILLLVQKGETRHWEEQSGRFEQLYKDQQAALATTVSNYRTAAAQAEAADKANSERVAAEQRTINERTDDDYQARLAAARSLAQRLRGQSAAAAADSRSSAAAPVSALSASTGGPSEAAGQDGLPRDDALTATEQSIQLDELIKWVKAQPAVDPDKNIP